ncbi:hypothetical protein GCM10027519_24330 [Kineococcus endophyticus]
MLSYADSTSPELSVLAGALQPLLMRARTTGVDLMVVGAMARDLLVHHAQGTRPDRATRDIDIALAVARWSDLDDVMSSHPRVGDSPHRFLVRGVEVDVVPFRGVETSSRTIRWPNDHSWRCWVLRKLCAAPCSSNSRVASSHPSLPSPPSPC